MAIASVTELRPETAEARGRTPKRDLGSASGRWWHAPTESLAREVINAAHLIERWSWNRRWLNMVCQRFVTGRDVQASYNFSMVQRPSAVTRAYGNAVWKPPNYNGIATACDAYSARIWKNRPFIQVVPLASGGFKARVRAKRLSRFADAVFEETRFWNTMEEVGIDCMTTGIGAVKIHEDPNNAKHIAISRVHVDELLVSEEESLYQEPFSMLQRAFFHREDLLARYPEHAVAIRRAASVHPAFYWGGDINYRDIVPAVEGWAKPTGAQPGRHCRVIPGCVLSDIEYKRRFFPFSIVRFRQLTGSWFGQGLAEQLLGLQAEISRLMAAMQEMHERVAWPRIEATSDSDLHIEETAGVPGGVYTRNPGSEVKWIVPPAVPPELYAHLERLIELQKRRARLSENAMTGQKPPGVNSGVGLMAYQQIDDAAHVDLGQRQEDMVTDVAKKVFMVAEDVQPRVVAPGRRGEVIDWKDAKLSFDPSDLTSSEFNARAFPMSRLPQTIAAREQVINDWLANGQISRADAMRLQQVPDTDGYMDLATAARDDIERTLDEMVESGDWTPPMPFQDLQLALQVAQSRYLYERGLETPEDRLQLLLRWIICVGDLIDDATAASAPPPGAPPGGPAPVGIQPPAGPGLAPTPVQVTTPAPAVGMGAAA